MTHWSAKHKGGEAYLTPRPFWSELNDLMYAFSDIPLIRTASARSNITCNLSKRQTERHGSRQSLKGFLHGQSIEKLTSKPRLTWTRRSPGRWWPCRPRPAIKHTGQRHVHAAEERQNSGKRVSSPGSLRCRGQKNRSWRRRGGGARRPCGWRGGTPRDRGSRRSTTCPWPPARRRGGDRCWGWGTGAGGGFGHFGGDK